MCYTRSLCLYCFTVHGYDKSLSKGERGCVYIYILYIYFEREGRESERLGRRGRGEVKVAELNGVLGKAQGAQGRENGSAGSRIF